MQTDIDPRSLIGRKAFDRDGAKIGTVDEVYLDDATGVPEWAAVRTGLFSRDAFVPLEPSELVDDVAAGPASTSALIKDAPDFGVGRHLSPEQELQLYHHYGLDVPLTHRCQPDSALRSARSVDRLASSPGRRLTPPPAIPLAPARRPPSSRPSPAAAVPALPPGRRPAPGPRPSRHSPGAAIWRIDLTSRGSARSPASRPGYRRSGAPAAAGRWLQSGSSTRTCAPGPAPRPGTSKRTVTRPTPAALHPARARSSACRTSCPAASVRGRPAPSGPPAARARAALRRPRSGAVSRPLRGLIGRACAACANRSSCV